MTTGSLFQYVDGFPSGFASPFTISVGGQVVGTYGPGQEVDFTAFPGGGVSSFTITGISPGVDPSNSTAFPLNTTALTFAPSASG